MVGAPMTVYIFPDRCSIGVADCTLQESPVNHIFGFLEFHIGQSESERFDEIYDLLRKTRSVRVVHLPNVLEDQGSPGNSTIVISFHESRDQVDVFEEPVLAAIVHVDNDEDLETLTGFNQQVIQDGHFCVSLTMGHQTMFLFLVEVDAIAEPMSYASFRAMLASFIGQPKFYAEYNPPLREPIDQLLQAIDHYRSSLTDHDENGSINLTGLVPEGLA